MARSQLVRCCWALRLLECKVAPTATSASWRVRLQSRCEEYKAASDRDAPPAACLSCLYCLVLSCPCFILSVLYCLVLSCFVLSCLVFSCRVFHSSPQFALLVCDVTEFIDNYDEFTAAGKHVFVDHFGSYNQHKARRCLLVLRILYGGDAPEDYPSISKQEAVQILDVQHATFIERSLDVEADAQASDNEDSMNNTGAEPSEGIEKKHTRPEDSRACLSDKRAKLYPHEQTVNPHQHIPLHAEGKSFFAIVQCWLKHLVSSRQLCLAAGWRHRATFRATVRR
jgi:hypothetical protein